MEFIPEKTLEAKKKKEKKKPLKNLIFKFCRELPIDIQVKLGSCFR